MSARILVVDDLAPNRNLFEVKLRAEYYDVLTARSGQEALDIAAREPLDLILMDAIMPGMNGFDACAVLKGDPNTWHVPVIMVTALEETKDRIRGLEAGADDFISKPIDDFNLMARVKSLLRLKMVTDQLLSHTGHTIENSRPIIQEINQRSGRILLVEDHPQRARHLADKLNDIHDVTIVGDPIEAIRAAKGPYDLVIVTLVSNGFDGLRICASIRFNTESRETPILIIDDPDNQARLLRAYDIGVNDTVMQPVDTQELLARVNSQLRRKFYADSLRDNFNENLEMVVSDPLTGLGNRRYFNRATEPLIDALESRDVPFSVMVFDIDHFKRVNDILGHDMGDHILKEVSARLVTNMRAIDVVSRYGGEEFMIAMPDTVESEAVTAADRLRAMIANTPVYVDGQALTITVSAGVAQISKDENMREALKRADIGLYKAKRAGRNCVFGASHTDAPKPSDDPTKTSGKKKAA